MRFLRLLVFGLGSVLIGGCQEPAFDVASLKPSPPATGDTYRANLGMVLHGELTMNNVTLSDCLRFAYNITNDSQIDGPGWIKNKGVRFDIVAKTAPHVSLDEVALMLRTLLNERFQMTLHHERRELSYLALEVSRKGSKLIPSQREADNSKNHNGLGQVRSAHISMSLLATLLSRFLRETVIDLTGLKGFYELNLEWRPEDLNKMAKPDDARPDETEAMGGASIFSAIQSQLGLKLEARKGPVDVIVIDRALRNPVKN
jgi:uncharacterized protein (TIGR03435 family)